MANTGAAVVESGTYLLEIDIGSAWDAFTLDNATKGVLNNTSYVLDGTNTWVDVTSTTYQVDIKRGRRDVGDQFTAGTMSWTMFDPDGYWNPFNTSSPYYLTSLGLPGLAPLKKVRIARQNGASWDYLFNGRVVNFGYDFGNPGDLSRITVYCADDFYLLSQTQLADNSVSEQLSGARLNTVLSYTEVNYPTGAARNIATGTQTLGGTAAYNISNGTSVMNYVNQVNLAEQGRVFMSRSGVFTFIDRVYANELSAAVADFHDDGTNIPYNYLQISFEADRVINRAVVTNKGSNTHVVSENLASQTLYNIQTATLNDVLLHNDAAAGVLGSYILYPNPTARYQSVGADYTLLTNAQRQTVSVVDIGDTINVQKQIQTGPTTYTQFAQACIVEGIETRINFKAGANTTLYTTPYPVVAQFVLNDATYGILDGTSLLG